MNQARPEPSKIHLPITEDGLDNLLVRVYGQGCSPSKLTDTELLIMVEVIELADSSDTGRVLMDKVDNYREISAGILAELENR
jgi:hypothetical protein